MQVVTAKRALRRAIRAQLRTLSRQEITAASAAIQRRLEAMLPPGLVLLYAAIRAEIVLDEVAARLATAGRLALPRVSGDELVVHRVDALASLELGAFGIREPPRGSPVVHIGDVAGIVVPGLAFDRSGARLGRGRGYYDRLLARAPGIHRIGVAHPFQLVDDVPTELTDRPVDVVLTPEEAVRP